ncbi:TraB/GumN family protein [Roseateles sp. SL47]|uniref:TraB/GumN family protein n=1 Tax=Roseateles sp. SL47 TaxID=2995138 RepID=UPI00226F32AD|nr:TraB/GumN family protein [Roseateles sp. SL47]WAC73837.1 TraB/GumN family protein [Roseateles sp. SL47]
MLLSSLMAATTWAAAPFSPSSPSAAPTTLTTPATSAQATTSASATRSTPDQAPAAGPAAGPAMAPAAASGKTPAKPPATSAATAQAAASATAPAACPTEPAPIPQDQAEAQAKDRGILWTLTRDGHTSYLHASLHLGRPAWTAPGPKLRQALNQVDAVALELDPLDAASWVMPTIPELTIDPALQKRLAAQARSVCLPAQAVAAMHPLLQLSTITLMQARGLGLDVRYGQEMLLSRWARDRHLPVIALETLQGQLSALLPEDADQARHELRSGLQQLERPAALQRMLKDLVGTWERGDLRRLARYEDWCDCIRDARDREALARENDGRNPNLADRISELHQRGQSLLVAVGALHMTGPQALPTLLREKGFEVTQVHPGAAK